MKSPKTKVALLSFAFLATPAGLWAVQDTWGWGSDQPAAPAPTAAPQTQAAAEESLRQAMIKAKKSALCENAYRELAAIKSATGVRVNYKEVGSEGPVAMISARGGYARSYRVDIVRSYDGRAMLREIKALLPIVRHACEQDAFDELVERIQELKKTPVQDEGALSNDHKALCCLANPFVSAVEHVSALCKSKKYLDKDAVDAHLDIASQYLSQAEDLK